MSAAALDRVVADLVLDLRFFGPVALRLESLLAVDFAPLSEALERARFALVFLAGLLPADALLEAAPDVEDFAALALLLPPDCALGELFRVLDFAPPLFAVDDELELVLVFARGELLRFRAVGWRLLAVD